MKFFILLTITTLISQPAFSFYANYFNGNGCIERPGDLTQGLTRFGMTMGRGWKGTPYANYTVMHRRHKQYVFSETKKGCEEGSSKVTNTKK